MNKYLLPAGFRDKLATQSRAEFEYSTTLVSKMLQFGYDLITPPLLEFESNIDDASILAQSFSLYDADSKAALKLRSDITPQIGRIVQSRLADAALPLRICYMGDSLNTNTTNTKGDRDAKQIGAELIHNKAKHIAINADQEIFILLQTLLKQLQLKDIVIDFTLPGFVSNLCEHLALDTTQMQIVTDSLKQQNPALLDGLPNNIGNIFATLLTQKDISKAYDELHLQLPSHANDQLKYALDLFNALSNNGANLSIDLSSISGDSYHTEYAFKVYAANHKDIIAKGGRYHLSNINGDHLQGVGFTIYLNNTDLRFTPNTKKLCIMGGIDAQKLAELQQQYSTIFCLSGDVDEAKKLGCGFIYDGKDIKAI